MHTETAICRTEVTEGYFGRHIYFDKGHQGFFFWCKYHSYGITYSSTPPGFWHATLTVTLVMLLFIHLSCRSA